MPISWGYTQPPCLVQVMCILPKCQWLAAVGLAVADLSNRAVSERSVTGLSSKCRKQDVYRPRGQALMGVTLMTQSHFYGYAARRLRGSLAGAGWQQVTDGSHPPCVFCPYD